MLPFLVKVDVFTPITWPRESISGPPEFPVHTPTHMRIQLWKVLKSNITWIILAGKCQINFSPLYNLNWTIMKND